MLNKLFLSIALLLFSLSSFAETRSFMPDNDLWKQDKINKSTDAEEKAMFERIIEIAKDIYTPMATANNEDLVINALWSDPTVNANVSRWWGTVTVNMYGGLFRRAEVSYEGFALVLCHEVGGHAYGGIPYISTYNKLSAEGQADYAGAKDCVEQILDKLNLDKFKFKPTEYMIKVCNETNELNYNLCLQSLTAGQSLGTLLATLSKESTPNYETPDKTKVTKTELSYPKTTQCRLDTYHNGTLHLKRPACWYKE